MMSDEIWRPIPGFNGYEISNIGRVKSYKRNWNQNNDYRILKTRLDKGYEIVNLYKNEKLYTKTIHQIVGLAFIPNPDDKRFINHKNGIKTDNRVSNLEWCTQRENNLHAIKTGLRGSKGEGNGNSKLSRSDVIEIRSIFRQNDISYPELAEKYNVTSKCIGQIIRREKWDHLEPNTTDSETQTFLPFDG